MAINIYGGGALTNVNGLRFEQDTDLSVALRAAGYVLDANGYVYHNSNLVVAVARSASKHKLYKFLLKPIDIIWNDVISAKLLPDEALLNLQNNTIYIIEKKFQNTSGSTDEKLQTCDFKYKQYIKLFAPVNIMVEYIYICNDWFLKDRYRDVRDYIQSVGCHIFFNEIPLQMLGL